MPANVSFSLRALDPADLPAVERVHTASIRGLCGEAYDAETLERWAANPDGKRYQRMLQPGNLCLVALMPAGEICGFGSLQIEKARLASLFVHPDQAGTGVGALLLARLEALAREAGLDQLHVESSLNAQSFYARHGFELNRRGKYCMSTGLSMECAEMTKPLRD
ncbi:MAG TPA: GNAT family N-acetyltransferase [Gammaproteobacteria bacterium]|nr:GNAT family N-acetyltransferase [Gammaproteobacteria bacterium]